MRLTSSHLLSLILCTCNISHFTVLSAEDRIELNSRVTPRFVRDIMWVWNTYDRAQPDEHTLATYAEANATQKMQLLNIPNVMMCGSGLPADDKQAFELTHGVSNANRLVWEITTDNGLHKPPFAYTKTAARVRRLVDEYPKIEAILLDDMSSLSVNAGFKAAHILAIRDLLPDKYSNVKIWGVVYTMNMRQPGMDAIIKTLDVVNLWVWNARDLVDLDKHVAFIEQLVPEKPIVLGLYLFNYGGGGRITPNLLESQCQTALNLAQTGRIGGMVFLTITNDTETLQWTANWIQEVGEQKIGTR